MKKLFMALVLSLTISASCFAAGASGRFAAEEKAADALIAALSGNGTYEQVSKSFTQALKTKIKAENFKALQDGIKKQVGSIKNPNFVLLNKQYDPRRGYSGVDELMYLGTVANDKFARILISFIEENNAPKVAAFQVAPLAAQRNENAAKK